MSIKLWEAWKIPYPERNLKYLYSMIEFVDKVAEERVRERFSGLLEDAIKSQENRPEKHIPPYRRIEMMIEASGRLTFNPFSVEMGFDWITYVNEDLHFPESSILILPYGLSLEGTKVERPEFVTDFQYQNQVDLDDYQQTIPLNEWAHRSQVWNDVLYGEDRRSFFTHVSTTARGFYNEEARGRVGMVLFDMQYSREDNNDSETN